MILVDQAEDVAGIKVLAARLDGIDPSSLRDTVDRLKDRLGSSVVVIGSADGRQGQAGRRSQQRSCD